MHHVEFVSVSVLDRTQAVCDWVMNFWMRTEQSFYLYLHCLDQAQAYHLDKILWTFDPGVFIPHALAFDSECCIALAEHIPIHLGYLDTHAVARQGANRQILFNLSDHIPDVYTEFDTIVELVFMNDEQDRIAKRQRYLAYRRLGLRPILKT